MKEENQSPSKEAKRVTLQDNDQGPCSGWPPCNLAWSVYFESPASDQRVFYGPNTTSDAELIHVGVRAEYDYERLVDDCEYVATPGNPRAAEEVSIAINGTLVGPAQKSGGYFSLALTRAQLSAGTVRIEAAAYAPYKDAFNGNIACTGKPGSKPANAKVKQVIVVQDQEPPILSGFPSELRVPSSYQFNFSGTASDGPNGIGVALVEWAQDRINWQAAATSDGWQHWQVVGSLTKDRQDHVVYLRATDGLGNQTPSDKYVSVVIHPFDIDPPVIAVDTPGEDEVIAPSEDNRDNGDVKVNVEGTVYDKESPVASLQYRVDTQPGWQDVLISPDQHWNVTISVPVPRNDAKHSIHLRATDSAPTKNQSDFDRHFIVRGVEQ